MLEALRVRNLAIAEDVSVEFAAGLNVITGETGAGKSILADALGLVLGDRVDRSLIRAGADQCTVEAAFRPPDPARLSALLQEAGLDGLDDGALVLRRTFAANGGGRVFVNGSPTTVAVLRGVGERLVDQHGPHEHQSLLHPEFQLDVLDAFAGLGDERAAYAALYEGWSALRRERAAFDAGERTNTEWLELLRHQAAEIAQAALSEEEADEVERDHTTAAHAQHILESSATAGLLLTEGETNAFTLLAEAQRPLRELAGLLPEAEAWSEELATLTGNVRDLSRALQDASERVQAGVERLAWLEERKGLYEALKRKYGGSVGAVLAHGARAEERLREYETRDERIAELERRLTEEAARVRAAAAALGKRRRAAARTLVRDITLALRDLGFPDSAFDVALRAVEPGATGADEVEYGFAPNPGEPMRPLRAIASSGEISRVMLAIKAVLARHDSIPVLVFDEIDANLGGEMGHAVGAKLREAAQARQVIAITHLPQVAAHGQRHLAVEKEVRDGRTYTRIRTLTDDERVQEIARMLGGRGGSASVAHARELLSQAAAAARRRDPRQKRTA